MEGNNVPVYSMGVAERLTGLTGRQIRYWEQHGLLAPSRTKGRQRMYSEADIAKLKEIKRLLADGMPLERIKGHLAARDSKRAREEVIPNRLNDRGTPRVQSLYHATNRDQILRMIDKDK